MSKKIAILGGGAWGSALASCLTNSGHGVSIWARNAEAVASLEKGYAPRLEMEIATPHLASADSEEVLGDADLVLVALPSAATIDAVKLLAPLDSSTPIIWTAKGLVGEKDYLLPEYVEAELKNPLVLLSGPSFADEVAAGKPTAIVAASTNEEAVSATMEIFSGTNLRIYSSADTLGVATGGVVKNVIAIASGIVSGLDLGDNARAALITRGLAEAMRFALAKGGKAETLFGLAGLGDMVLSCGSVHSRNFAYGFALGRGEQLPDALTEGSRSAIRLRHLAASLNIEMPITEAVGRVLEEGTSIKDEIARLLERPSSTE